VAGCRPARPYTELRVHYAKAGLDYSGKGPGWMHIRDYSLGVILNWGTHILDITQWALNTERNGPVEIEGRGEFPKDNLRDMLQQFEVRYRYASGIEVIYTTPGGRSSVSKAARAGSRTPGSSRTASSPPTTNSCDGIRGPTT